MIKSTHPYKKYEALPLWAIVDRAVRALSRNGDIAEQTDRHYIVGFLCKQILEPKSHRKTRANRNDAVGRVLQTTR